MLRHVSKLGSSGVTAKPILRKLKAGEKEHHWEIRYLKRSEPGLTHQNSLGSLSSSTPWWNNERHRPSPSLDSRPIHEQQRQTNLLWCLNPRTTKVTSWTLSRIHKLLRNDIRTRITSALAKYENIWKWQLFGAFTTIARLDTKTQPRREQYRRWARVCYHHSSIAGKWSHAFQELGEPI